MEMLTDRFRIDEYAGHGGFGSLYRGYDLRMEREVAIKIVDTVKDKEAMILKNLDHPGLPRLYDIVNEETKTYLVMEWIPGINLDEYMCRYGAMSEEKAIRIGRELLDILEYLHGQKQSIIYQDLKPANIMLMPNGHIKIVDFGTAFSKKYDDSKVITAGTAGYGSPEQRGIHGNVYVDERSDIYSWGACMYSFVSGRSLCKPPYTMENPRRVCPQLSFGMERIIRKATKRDAGDRYKSVALLKQALGRIGFCDIAYKLIHALIVFSVIMPLLYAWYMSYRIGLFAFIEEGILRAWRIAGIRGLGVVAHAAGAFKQIIQKENWDAAFSVVNLQNEDMGSRDAMGRYLGYIIVSAVWMIAGLGRLATGKTIRTKRSVFLSEKTYPGIWLGVMLSGLLIGYAFGNRNFTTVALAAERGEILPVSIVEENGMKTLVRFDSAYETDGNIVLEIPGEAIPSEGQKNLTISLIGDSGDIISYRTIILN